MGYIDGDVFRFALIDHLAEELPLGVAQQFPAAALRVAIHGEQSALRNAAEGEAWTALVALGYKPAEVTQMLKPFAGSGGSTEDLIRRALQGAVRPQ